MFNSSGATFRVELD